jgi:hypothetical protein
VKFFLPSLAFVTRGKGYSSLDHSLAWATRVQAISRKSSQDAPDEELWGQPSTQISDRVGVGVAEMEPGFLDRVVCLREGAEQLVGHRSQVRTLGLEGLGLILPMYLCILPILTPLAAIGLIIEMIGATIFIPFFYGFTLAASPVVTGLLLAFVGYGCWLQQRHSFI